MNQDSNQAPGRQKPRNNIYLIIAILLLGPIFFFSYQDSKRIRESLTGTDPGYYSADRETPEFPLPTDKPADYGDTEVPPPIDLPLASNTINLSIGKYRFVPVEFLGPASSSVLNIQLTRDKPDAIRQAPAYKTGDQWYGYMDLGNRGNKRFHFVLDQHPDTKWSLYFDKNNNGDLTDDGGPVRNQGSGTGGPGGFACLISIPWAVLITDSRFPGDFTIWFFSNEAGWKNGYRASHYSRTQLQGKFRIGNHDYLALLIDQGYNDADLTNDGVAIDLNRDGKIDQNEMPKTVHNINGETYAFNVTW